MKLPAELKPADLVAIVDSREQLPLDLSPLKTEVGTLSAGDYSLRNLTEWVRIERKGDDLPSCCGTGRNGFMDQMWRLKAFPVKALVLEYGWPEIEMGHWASKISPQSVVSTLLGIVEMGIPVIAAGNRARAGQYIAKLLFLTANRRYREIRGLVQPVDESAEVPR